MIKPELLMQSLKEIFQRLPARAAADIQLTKVDWKVVERLGSLYREMSFQMRSSNELIHEQIDAEGR